VLDITKFFKFYILFESNIFYRRVLEKVIDLGESRKKRRESLDKISKLGYFPLDLKFDRLDWTPPHIDYAFLTFKRLGNTSLLSIFLKIVTVQLMTKIIENINPDDFIMRFSPFWIIQPTIVDFYKILAISIRIQGLNKIPRENRKNNRPIRESIIEAVSHFQGLYGSRNVLGINIIERLVSLPLFMNDYYNEISINFQSLVLNLGESIAGDEKLLYFTGNSQDIRLVPAKPSRIGLWFYELCSTLRNGGQYMLFSKLHRGGEYTSVSSVVENWIQVIKRLGNEQTLLTMDSYYLDNTSKELLERSGVKYVAAFTSNKFQEITKEMITKVNIPGEWYGIYNPTNLNSIVYHWCSDDRVGKKWVMSNACVKNRSRLIGTNIPLFDLYKVTFNVCDKFNRSLHDTFWPHRKGGSRRYGGQGCQHNFMFTCILHNTFNCFMDLNSTPHAMMNFESYCLELADLLFEYATKMSN
jgi:hypothetical protein